MSKIAMKKNVNGINEFFVLKKVYVHEEKTLKSNSYWTIQLSIVFWSIYFRCDGIIDCDDNSDEESCTQCNGDSSAISCDSKCKSNSYEKIFYIVIQKSLKVFLINIVAMA